MLDFLVSILNPCLWPGSIIECEAESCVSASPIVGTPYTLNYRSSRAFGDKGEPNGSGPNRHVDSGLLAFGGSLSASSMLLDNGEDWGRTSPSVGEIVTLEWDRERYSDP